MHFGMKAPSSHPMMRLKRQQLFLPHSTLPPLFMVMLLLLLPSLPTVSASAEGQHSNSQTWRQQKAEDVIHWVKSMFGGQFNEKQTVGMAAETAFHRSSDIGLGTVAHQRISRGEMLASIPWGAIIYDEKNFGSDGSFSCATANKLIDELELGEDSVYGPYIEYLQSRKQPSMLPTTWTPQGQHLLQHVLNGTIAFNKIPPKEPTSWLTNVWENGCLGTRSEVGDFAALTVLTMAHTAYLAPILDIYNHASGARANVNVHVRQGISIDLFASREVQAGEELCVSYSEDATRSRPSWYGTQELFRDYGFIEDYPQKWAFITDDYRMYRAIFHINRLPTSAKLDATDLSDQQQQQQRQLEYSYAVTWDQTTEDEELLQDMVVSLRRYLNRLGRIRSGELAMGPRAWAVAHHGTADDEIPFSEWNAVVKFVDAAIVVIGNALRDTDDDVGAGIDPNHAEHSTLFGCINGVDDTCLANQLYPEFIAKPELYRMRSATCDIQTLLRSGAFVELSNFESEYQKVIFMQSKENLHIDSDDMCLELDGIIQICDSYRPHYHEYAVNYGARYLKQLKRAAFIGGGDSMILQELLKYPDLELVPQRAGCSQTNWRCLAMFGSQKLLCRM